MMKAPIKTSQTTAEKMFSNHIAKDTTLSKNLKSHHLKGAKLAGFTE